MGQLEDDPVRLMIDWAYQFSADDLEIIHIRDWHNPEDPAQAGHLKQFGSHCVQNTPGAEFVFQDRIKKGRTHHILSATGLNDFNDTSIAEILEINLAFTVWVE